MLKFVGILGSVFASVVIVPAAALDGGRRESPVESLEAALGQTVEALELLAGMKARAEEGHEITAIAARQISETPTLGDQERDEKLQLLRTQVALLQQELDILEYRAVNIHTGTSFREEEAPKKDGIPTTLVRREEEIRLLIRS